MQQAIPTVLSLVLLVGALLCSGCPRGTPVSSGSVAPVTPPPPVLGIDDVIEVRVYLEPSLTGEYTVDSDGNIAFPLLGTVKVLGLAPGQVGTTLTARLREGYLNDPQVSISVLEFNSRQISVLGEVKSPGRYLYREGMTLIQAIAEAGGTTREAVLSSMQVTRTQLASTQQTRYEVPFRDITLGRQSDFALLPGDVIVVQESAVK